MKEVLFTEDQLADLGKIGEKLLFEETDPRSMYYQRKLVRPRINMFKVFLCVLIPLAAAAGIGAGLHAAGASVALSIIAAFAVLTLYTAATLKKAAVCCVRIYQRFAPDKVRMKCRFEPSCSEYMITSIEKYGVIKGAAKGINRLKRCNINGGGYDYP